MTALPVASLRALPRTGGSNREPDRAIGAAWLRLPLPNRPSLERSRASDIRAQKSVESGTWAPYSADHETTTIDSGDGPGVSPARCGVRRNIPRRGQDDRHLVPTAVPRAQTQPANVEFLAAIQDALPAGYRPCKRCRPTDVNGSAPQWVRRLLARVEQAPDGRLRDQDLRATSIDPTRARRYFTRWTRSTLA